MADLEDHHLQFLRQDNQFSKTSEQVTAHRSNGKAHIKRTKIQTSPAQRDPFLSDQNGQPSETHTHHPEVSMKPNSTRITVKALGKSSTRSLQTIRTKLQLSMWEHGNKPAIFQAIRASCHQSIYR